MPNYNPREIEPRWQHYWETNATFACPDPTDPSVAGKPKVYILDMFPYPSGSGLHVGHPEGYTATDILCRHKRMAGFHVLHPMGWDAFGLPAEQHAITTGEHPSINTQNNIDNFRRQIKSLGFSYDWDREVDTTDPHYFKWTQWIFLLLHDTWYDHDLKMGRPISELEIPEAVIATGESSVRAFRDYNRLAYSAEVPVNWCPALGTVLSNEEVIDGKSERGNYPVVRRPLQQWMLRITDYAERLIDDLEPLDWSESIKQMQRNWIGRSEGAVVHFGFANGNADWPESRITVFTTRPDTLYGATYLVYAPEHYMVEIIATAAQKEAVEAYRLAASRKSDFDRTEMAKEKTGVFTGAYAINPVNGKQIPIWIADYVLATYGTGAIMAVPAHDERDFEFAKKFNLPVTLVVQPTKEWFEKTKSLPDNLSEAYCEEGVACNSGMLDGLTTADAKQKIIADLEKTGAGKRRVNYKLRDWLFSRQRYWGEPFPLLHELDADGKPTGTIRAVDVKDLPVTLPAMADFKPTGSPEGPLAKATEWMNVEIDGKKYRRETNTMPQWAGSCWYYLRYLDPKNDKAFCDPEKAKHWLPVDLYVGGAEHAVLHLLYSRFWHKVLFDRGYVHCPEPFQKLVNQGMILGEMEYRISADLYEKHRAGIEEQRVMAAHVKTDEGDYYVLRIPPDGTLPAKNLPDERIEKRKGKTYLAGTELELTGRADKMSKSRGNVINPDDVVKEYGADSLRLYEMFMGPLEATKPWSMKSVEGVYRFLSRVWRLIVDDRAETNVLSPLVKEVEPDTETTRLMHKLIQKVTDDTTGLRFNTAIAAMMEFSNHLTAKEVRPRKSLETLVLLLAPYAPHVSEELWRVLGHGPTLAYEPWPIYDPKLLIEDEIEIPIQINGKIKVKLMVPAGIGKDDLEKLAMSDAKVQEQLAGKTIKKTIVVPGKMVNIVIV